MRLIDYNPDTGLITKQKIEEGVNHISYEQDVEPYLDINAEYRALSGDGRDAQGIKEGFWHVGFVPDSVILKMRFEDGVDFYDKEQWKRVLQLIETKYPKCKVTNKRIA